MIKEEFILMALNYLGFPSIKYRGEKEGKSPGGFDCSGFIYFLLRQAGYPGFIPRHSNEQFDELGILVHEPLCRVGDLVFFSVRSYGAKPDHVGIMISSNEYVHSPGKDGENVRVVKLEHEVIKPQTNTVQIYSQNPIGFKRVTVREGRYNKPFFE